MNICQVIKIQTPKKFLLDGLWLGPAKAKTVLVLVHGLGGDVFSRNDLIDELVTKERAVLAFNNRGSGIVTRFAQLDSKKPKVFLKQTIGMAHEVFTDCLDDLEGAINFAKKMGAKQIILIGHSAGSQKSIYYLAKRTNPLVKGVILLAPMSDYADMVKATPPREYKKLVALARQLVAEGKPHELMPAKLWSYTMDAQRFLSLFTPESEEEIFSYASGKRPVILNKVKQPILVVLAGQDEYRERPMAEIATWFKTALAKQTAQVVIVPKATHGFFESTQVVTKLINGWLKTIKF